LQQWLQEGPEAAMVGAPGGTAGGAGGEGANRAAEGASEGPAEGDTASDSKRTPVLNTAVAKESALRHSEEV